MSKQNLAFYALIAGTLVVFFAFVIGFSQSGATGNVPANSGPQQIPAGGSQAISIHANAYGTYDATNFVVKKGVPVQVSFSADPNSGCGRELLIPAFGVDLLSRRGEITTATFTPQKEGKFDFHCSMRMFRGTIDVVP